MIIARNLGRDGETVDRIDLGDLDVDQIDMLTLVVVGASSTRTFVTGGRTWTYTPRGYANKQAGP